MSKIGSPIGSDMAMEYIKVQLLIQFIFIVEDIWLGWHPQMYVLDLINFLLVVSLVTIDYKINQISLN